MLGRALLQPRPTPEGVCCGEDETYIGARGLRGLWGSSRSRESTKPWSRGFVTHNDPCGPLSVSVSEHLPRTV